MVRTWKIGTVLLALLLLPGCAGMDAAPAGKADEAELSVAARFQTESGDALQGAACFSTETDSRCCRMDSDGTVSVSGLPRDEKLLLTVFGRQQEVQGAMTLLFDRGAVTDAMTGEDGVGHITVRHDAGEVALIFILEEGGALRCALWLARAAPSDTDLP